MIENIMKLDISNLAVEQHKALTKHVLERLKEVGSAIKNLDHEAIEKLTNWSPSGDDMGCDNAYINFSWNDEPKDILEVFKKLIELSRLNSASSLENLDS